MKAEHGGEVILYREADGSNVVQLRASGGTVWLTQTEIASLYDTTLPNIAQIIRRILEDREVTEATINSELRVRSEGTRQVQREVKIYNLDMVLAIGYRVTTSRAVQFRQWATTTLHEYLVKGFAMNDRYLKDSEGVDYFDELLERIRSIRASEKRFYQKIRELFKATSADYDGQSDVARTFFATIQNKLLYAVTGHTAAELVVSRVDVRSPTLGLTSWRGATVKRADAEIAKNYLNESEIKELDRLTTMFLDYVEDRAERRIETSMADWTVATERFLAFNERQTLRGAGRVSHESMKSIVQSRFEEHEQGRRLAEAQRAEIEERVDLTELMRAANQLTESPTEPDE
ncbi:RhuM family protein [Citricoccus sp. NPDC079358]|uniref:RhuM family protein n=1 Tax=Citricoccus sp. NPDC079358 TaxID=3154653 RepID=UPI00344BE017